MVDRIKIIPDSIKTVVDFRIWWLESGCPIVPPFKDAINFIEIAASLVLFRESRFQVELYITKPNTESPSHKHPGVDSDFVYLTGNLTFSRDGNAFADTSQYQYENPSNGAHILLGTPAPRFNTDGAHAVRMHAEGGAFLSFEMWDEDIEINSVTQRWEGMPADDTHKELLKSSN